MPPGRSGPQPSRLPSPMVQTTLWCVVAVAVVALLADRTGPLAAPEAGWTAFAALTVLSLAAARQDVWAQLRTRKRDVQEMVDLDEVAMVVLLLVLEPMWATAVAVATYSIALSFEKRAALKTVFNMANRTATVGFAALLAAPFTDPPVEGLDLLCASVVTGAVLLHVVLNFLSVKLVVTAATGSTLRRTIRTTADLNIVMWIGNATLGLAAAALWLHHPVLVLAAAVLGVVLRRAYHTVVIVSGLVEEIEVERDRLRQLVDGGRDGVLQLDAQGRVVVWNPALEQLTGVAADVAIGAPIDQLLAGRVVVRQGPASMAAAVLGHAPPADQHVTVDVGGEQRSLVARHSLQQDRDGDVLCDIVQLHDRTASERAARAEHDILSRVTHELLTPLTMIRGFAQTVARHGDELGPAMRQDLLARLSDNTVRMEGLVHDLLAVSSHQPTDRGDVDQHDLLPLVAAAAEIEAASCDDRAVEVVGENVDALVSPSSFTTVVRHLVRNACTYSPTDTEVTVTLDLDRATATAILQVRDHGRGIPSSRLEEMFSPFTRVENPLQMETRGVGLGLHLVRQLVDELDGTVHARSTVGVGSTFEVRLPAVAAAGADGEST